MEAGVTMLVISKSDLENIIEQKVLSAINMYLYAEKNKDREPDIMTLEEAGKYLNLKPNTIYVMKCGELIPYVKRGRKLCFSRVALDAWNLAGRPKNPNRLEIEADEQLASIRRKKKK